MRGMRYATPTQHPWSITAVSTDYPTATGQPRTVTLAGREYRVAKLSPKMLGKLDAWLKDQVPNPLLEAREHMLAMRDLPLEVQKHVWDCALVEKADWPPRHTSATGNELLFSTFDGLREFLFVLIAEATPGFTREQAGEIVDSLAEGGDDIKRLLELVSPGEVGDPKAKAPETVAT